MNCKFGMPTLIEKNSIADNVILCKELGLDFVELNMNLPYCMPENNSTDTMIALKNKYDIEFTVHFPEDVDFGCFYEEMRQANIILYKKIATWASEFGAEKINIHLNPGVYFTLPNKKMFVYEKNKSMFVEKFMNSMESIRNISEPLGLKVCIENTKVKEFAEETFLKLCDMSNIFFTWDVGHDAMSGCRMEKIYLKNPRKVAHMHLHDYNGKSDHQVLFDGNIPLNERIKFAQDNDLTILVETKTTEALEESVMRLKNAGLL